MHTPLPRLEDDQWNLLGILRVLDSSLSLDLAGSLCPISLEAFNRLFGEKTDGKGEGLIRADGNGRILLSRDLPRAIVDQLDAYVHSEAFSEFVGQLNRMGSISIL